MNAWRYDTPGHVLLLARQNDFACLPPYLQQKFIGIKGAAWGSRPGTALPEKLVGANLSDIEEALKAQGWFLYKS